jgi:hypothetical protein
MANALLLRKLLQRFNRLAVKRNGKRKKKVLVKRAELRRAMALSQKEDIAKRAKLRRAKVQSQKEIHVAKRAAQKEIRDARRRDARSDSQDLEKIDA